MGREEGKHAIALDMVRLKDAAEKRKARLLLEDRDVVRPPGFQGQECRRLGIRNRRGVHHGYGLIGFEDMHADHALFGIEQREAHEVECQQGFEAAAEFGEEGGKAPVRGYGFGDFKQRFIARAGGVRGWERRRHRRAEGYDLQPYHNAPPAQFRGESPGLRV